MENKEQEQKQIDVDGIISRSFYNNQKEIMMLVDFISNSYKQLKEEYDKLVEEYNKLKEVK